MLDVQSGPDIDAGGEDLLDVLPALRMTRAGRIRVRVLIDQQKSGTPGDGTVDVELHQGARLVVDRPARHHLKPAQQAFGLAAAVGFDDPYNDIVALGLPTARGAQHFIGLPHAGGHA